MKKKVSLLLLAALLLSCVSFAYADEKPALKVLAFNAAFDANEDVNAKAVEDVTGYHVEYSMLPAENADQKLNVELASGSSYDIVKLTANQYYQLVGRGALLPLDDLLEEYGQDLKATISERSWKASSYDGKIYAVPMRKEYTKDIGNFIIYRQDILDELGLETPTTIEAFYDMLVKVKAAHPEMITLTGPQSEVGTGSNSWILPPTICSAFGIYNEWQDFDGELVPMIKSPRMKDMLTFMNKLYNEGLMDADWAVNTGTLVQEKFTSGNAFAAVTERNIAMLMIPTIQANIPEAKIGYILPLKGENGEYGNGTNDQILYYSCIPTTSKNAADAIKFMNEKAKWDNFLFLTLGTEGETFTKEENQANDSGYDWLPIMPIFGELRNNSYWYLNSIDEKNYGDMWLARVRKSPSMWEPFEKVSLAAVDAAKPNPIGYMPPSEAVSKYNQKLCQMSSDFYAQVMSGAAAINTYDSFLERWDKEGGADMTEAINAWYKEFNAK